MIACTIISKRGHREHRVIRTPGPNSLELIVENLRDTDNGDYLCEATPVHGEPEDKLSAHIKVNIKSSSRYQNYT